MMKFFHPVTTFSTTGKTEKGRILQAMALQFDRALIHGDSMTVSNIVFRMREIAKVIDARYPRTRPTFIDWCIDDKGNGQITASPMSDNAVLIDKDYFRITFNTVANAATIDEVLDRFTLSTLKIDGKPFKKGGEI